MFHVKRAAWFTATTIGCSCLSPYKSVPRLSSWVIPGCGRAQDDVCAPAPAPPPAPVPARTARGVGAGSDSRAGGVAGRGLGLGLGGSGGVSAGGQRLWPRRQRWRQCRRAAVVASAAAVASVPAGSDCGFGDSGRSSGCRTSRRHNDIDMEGIRPIPGRTTVVVADGGVRASRRSDPACGDGRGDGGGTDAADTSAAALRVWSRRER
jgi:hypothetical protein